jgi:hypothetical protein
LFFVLVLLAFATLAAGQLRPVPLLQGEGFVASAPRVGAAARGSQLPPIPVIQLDEAVTHPVLDGERLSLSFAAPVPILDILLMLVRR